MIEERENLSCTSVFIPAFDKEDTMIIGVFGPDDNGAVQEIFGEEIWVPNERTPGFADRSESNKRFWGQQ